MIAEAPPPPLQMAATPFCPGFMCSARMLVMRAPDILHREQYIKFWKITTLHYEFIFVLYSYNKRRIKGVPERVAETDRAAIGVEARRVELEQLKVRECHHSERLVHLPPGHVLLLHARLRQQLLYRVHRRHREVVRRHSRVRESYEHNNAVPAYEL